MSANNFMYENRCVVVTNENLEDEYLPALYGNATRNRNYPSKFIKEFNFFAVVLTYGYYGDACIDFIEHPHRNAYDTVVGLIGYPATQREFIQECKEVFGISERQIRQICGKVDGDQIDYYIEKASEKIGEYMAEKEKIEVNCYINSLKQQYGYEEYACIGVASNGEGFYEKI